MAKAVVREAGVPPGVKVVGKREVPLDAATIRKVLEGIAAKRRLEEAKERLEAINAELLQAHGTGCSLVVPGVCRASLSERVSVQVTDADRLRGVLGGRWVDLVDERVSYRPTEKLIELTSDGDHPLQAAVGECLTVSRSQSVTWRAEQ